LTSSRALLHAATARDPISFSRKELSMNLHHTGHHVEITPAIREYVTSKIARINRHFEHVIDVNVIMTVEKLDQKIEANVHLSGKEIHVQASEEDMYAAIDSLIDKLDRQVLRHKERFSHHGARNGQAIKRIPQT
jgi:putative sigma-54 modulation protein